MTDRHYLLKVLGISGLPRIATFLLSLLTVPILLRSVGAEQYGVFLYVGAALGICEVLIDFGVSSAAGKNMAEIRDAGPAAVRREFLSWARLQAIFVLLGFGPMLLAAYLALGGGNFHAFDLLLIMAVGMVMNVVLNFVRPNLQSLLAFRSLAILDTFESVARSSGLLAAAYLLPTAMGLALAGLCTAAVAGSLAAILIFMRLNDFRDAKVAPPVDARASGQAAPARHPLRLRESFSFLWLRISTRLFQELPTLMIGRTLGPELVGIIGAFRRIVEILNTPYLVIGNALMVRVNEVNRQGERAMQALWEAALRIVSTGFFVAALGFLAATFLARLLLPAYPQTPAIFRLLAPVVFLVSLIGVVAPMSDYLGALSRRNVILTVMALLQIPLQWLSMRFWGQAGAVTAYVGAHLVLALAYMLLAHRTFFGARAFSVRREVLVFGVACIAALAVTVAAWDALQGASSALVAMIGKAALPMQIAIFCLLLMLALLAHRMTLNYYFRRDFLDFTR